VSAKERVIFLIWDGARGITVNQMLTDGELPNLAYLVRRGTKVEYGVTVCPSTTGPAYAPFVTGNFAGKSNLPGIRWFDRDRGLYRVYCGTDSKAINKDLNPDFPTIYELLPKGESFSVFGMTDRGSSRAEMPMIPLALPKLTGDFDKMDVVLFDKFWKGYQEENFPTYAFLSLHGPDSTGHAQGIHVPEYKERLRFQDFLLGKLLNSLKGEGIFANTTIIITSDHGLSSTNKGIDLKLRLEEIFQLKIHDSVPRISQTFNAKYKAGLKKFDCIAAVSGNAFVMLYLKSPSSETMVERPSYQQLRNYPSANGKQIDLPGQLIKEEFISTVFVRENSKIHVMSRDGHGIIDTSTSNLRYEIAEGQDPFGYESVSNLYNQNHTSQEWLELTCHTKFPDAIVQVASLMSSPGAGDIVFIAAEGWEPWNEGQNGVHGSLEKEEMLVPIIISGEQIQNKQLTCARTADLFPLCCDLLQLNIPAGIDGNSLEIIKKDSDKADEWTLLAVDQIAVEGHSMLVKELAAIQNNRKKGILSRFTGANQQEKKLIRQQFRLQELRQELQRDKTKKAARNLVEMSIFAGGNSLTDLDRKLSEETNNNGFFHKLKTIFKGSRKTELQERLEGRQKSQSNLQKKLLLLPRTTRDGILDDYNAQALNNGPRRLYSTQKPNLKDTTMVSPPTQSPVTPIAPQELAVTPQAVNSELQTKYKILYQQYMDELSGSANSEKLEVLVEEMQLIRQELEALTPSF
jgi:arylsulfatase A-like enzyme